MSGGSALDEMRELLAELPLLHADRARLVTEHTPEHNRLLRRVSRAVRDAVGTTSPAHFRVNELHLQEASMAERRESMLAALEAEIGRHALVSIELPGFPLDPFWNREGPSPFQPGAPERRAPRLAALVRRCPRLQHLDVSDTRICLWGEIADALGSCPALRTLDAADNNMREEAEQLAGWLRGATALRELRLGGNRFTEARNVQWITDALPGCTALTHLDLSHNLLGQGAGRLLAAALPLCRALRHLDVSRNFMGEESADALAPALARCRCLEHLDLSNNAFDEESADVLSLPENRCASLRHLDLSHNRIGVDGLGMLGERQFGAGLAYLNLSHNLIRVALQQPVHAHELLFVRHLVELRLADNVLRDNFARTLVAALPACPALETLDLANTWLTDFGVAGLPLVLSDGGVAGLPQCRRLSKLMLGGTRNEFSPATTRALRAAWAAHYAQLAPVTAGDEDAPLQSHGLML